MVKSRGFTLLEMLIVLLCVPLIIELTIPLYRFMIIKEDTSINQGDIFLLQFKQLLYRSKLKDVMDDVIYVSIENKEYQIYLDGERIVKTPGYEILLEDVEEFEAIWEEKFECKFTYEDKEYAFEFKRGDYFSIQLGFLQHIYKLG